MSARGDGQAFCSILDITFTLAEHSLPMTIATYRQLNTTPLWRWCLVAAVWLCLAGVTQAQPARIDKAPAREERDLMRVEAAVDRGLEYLLRKQHSDGSWPSAWGKNNGINAICLLSVMGRGHVPGRGPYKEVLRRGIDFILATQDASGMYLSPSPTHGPMYEHALATTAMIEAYGYRPSTTMRQSVQKAVDLIVKSQTREGMHTGGWRYQPQPGDGDLSASVMQCVALRAAINAKLNVPRETIDRAIRYVRACAVAGHGFAYQPGQGPREPVTAAGVLALQLSGAFDDPAVKQGLDYLLKTTYGPRIQHFYYFNYYAMQAMYQAGGEYWNQWHGKARRWMLENQNEDGSFPGFAEQQYNAIDGATYSTAMALIALEVYLHYLPAYQR